jgi:hypothetical protein
MVQPSDVTSLLGTIAYGKHSSHSQETDEHVHVGWSKLLFINLRANKRVLDDTSHSLEYQDAGRQET